MPDGIRFPNSGHMSHQHENQCLSSDETTLDGLAGEKVKFSAGSPSTCLSESRPQGGTVGTRHLDL